jgi:hypothetical protein
MAVLKVLGAGWKGGVFFVRDLMDTYTDHMTNHKHAGWYVPSGGATTWCRDCLFCPPYVLHQPGHSIVLAPVHACLQARQRPWPRSSWPTQLRLLMQHGGHAASGANHPGQQLRPLPQLPSL